MKHDIHFLENKKTVNQIYIVLIIIGILTRLIHLFFIDIDLPFFLGGLYQEFINQIIINNFQLPNQIPFYTNGGIPFLYPPLPFYFTAIIEKTTNINNFHATNILPPLLSSISVWIFYLFIQKIDVSEDIKLFSLLIFVFYPPLIYDFIQAAGLSEAFGIISIILLMFFVAKHYKNPKLKSSLGIGLAFSLCFYTNPGSAYAAVIIMLYYFIFGVHQLINSKKHYLPQIFISLIFGTILLIPYILHIFLIGATEYIDIVRSLHSSLSNHFYNIFFNLIAYEPGLRFSFIQYILLLIGFVSVIQKRNYIYLLLFFSLINIPSEGNWIAAILECIIAGFGISAIIEIIRTKFTNYQLRLCFTSMFIFIIIGFFVMNTISLLNRMIFSEEYAISYDEINACYFVRDNIPNDIPIIVVGNAGLREWAPTLSRHTVLNTEFGAEWRPDINQSIFTFNNDISKDPSHSGLIQFVNMFNIQSDIVLITNIDNEIDISSFGSLNSFENIWINDQVSIYTMQIQ